jgi:glycosyltransferase involved in cell wall biosynthesis
MLKNNLISIVIPTYEMLGNGLFFLELSLKKILQQTYKNIEVVISDHSVDSKIEELILVYSDKLNIKYFKNNNNRGSSSANLNNGIINSSGSIIKILMQDDYLYEKTAIENIFNTFNQNENIIWLVTGCVYGNKNGLVRGNMFPTYTEDIIVGNNKIGSPSVLTIKNENPILFNNELIWMMDCDYYKRLFDNYGKPFVLMEHQVYITQHQHQLTSLLSFERKNKEVELIKNTYNLC